MPAADLEDGETSDRFQDYDIEYTYFIVQEYSFFFSIVVVIFLFSFLWLLAKYLCIEEQKKTRYGKKVKRKFRDALIRIALTFDTPVSLSFFLNIRDRTFVHALDIVSFISAVAALLFFIIVPIYFDHKILKNKHRLDDE